MINLEISNYPKSFNYLNGNKTQNIAPLDLARAMITTGQENWKDVFNIGIFRIGELICKALAYSEVKHGNLVLRDCFHTLNQSEKATISYYFGQGLTKLYAEEFFKIKWLFHVDDYDDILFHAKGIATSKIVIANTKKNAQRPDLIGIKNLKESHIFEAKGNSSCYDKSVMQHAINQVSQIKSYNGHPPLTRTACYYDLSKVPFQGIIIDPENDEKGIDITFDQLTAVTRYYSFFKENREKFTIPINFNGHQYLTTPIGVPNICFGFDKRILKMTTDEIIENGLYSEEIRLKSTENSSIDRVSLGYDGIILSNISNQYEFQSLLNI